MFNLSQCRDSVSVSCFLKRASIMHKRKQHITFWSEYNQTQKTAAWVSTEGRFFGISANQPTVQMQPGEYLVPFALPWHGCGRDVDFAFKKARAKIHRKGDSNFFQERKRDGSLKRPLVLSY